MCSLLIQKHKELNPKFLTTCDAKGNNILIYASGCGYLQIVKDVIDIFIETGTLNLKENTGMNALITASRNRNYECVEFLVGHFKTANLLHEKDESGLNAFEHAMENRWQYDIIKLLGPYYNV